jgi:hypothetical protein
MGPEPKWNVKIAHRGGPFGFRWGRELPVNPSVTTANVTQLPPEFLFVNFLNIGIGIGKKKKMRVNDEGLLGKIITNGLPRQTIRPSP